MFCVSTVEVVAGDISLAAFVEVDDLVFGENFQNAVDGCCINVNLFLFSDFANVVCIKGLFGLFNYF